MNPLSPASLQRPGGLYSSYAKKPAVTAAASLRACLRFREQLGTEDAQKFRVHLTSAMPTCAVVIIDDQCFWHPYLADFTGVNSPYLEDSVSSDFGSFLLGHVNSVIGKYSHGPGGGERAELAAALAEDPLGRNSFDKGEKQAIEKALDS